MKDLLLKIALAVFVGAAFIIIVWGMNTSQITECRHMGGFARTDVDGRLIECNIGGGR